MRNILKIKNPETGEFEPIAAISGADGTPGANGQGVPTGGTAGQILRKTGSGDYETEWNDKAGNSERLGGLDAQYYAQGRAAHNLLDNSDFTNPVNQRGATTATLGKYFIDRWNTEPFPSGPSITIDGNGLTLLPTTGSTAGIFQKIPDYEKRKGKIHTFAICVGNEWKCVSFTMGNFGVGYQIHGLHFFSTDSRYILIRNNNSDNPAPITIQRVALYEGSYTADTLPAYQPKGYAAELAECQRYYQQYNTNEMSAVGNSESGITYIRCPLKAPMRVAPSLVQSSVDMWTTYNETTNKTETFIFYASNPQCVNLKCTSSGGSVYQLVIATNNTAIGFSADL